MAECILVVDDHIEMADMLAEALNEAGWRAEALDSGARALERLEAGGVDALVTDLRMDGVGGLELLAASRRLDPRRPVIVMTAYGAIDTAVDSIRQGAYHYLTKPFQPEELKIFLRRALEEQHLQAEAQRLRKALREHQPIDGMVGSSPAMREVLDLVNRLAVVDVPVLIQGETGTGKSLVAGAIHARSARAKGPFVSINCAALPEALLESELFGHAKGAFTGATSERSGLFAEAESGTLLLDEIGELPLAIQAKLLHVLERGTVRPVGSNRERKVDVRILAATHRDLHDMAQRQQFREDLLYRLDVVTIEIPALKHRKEDILPLIDHFLGIYRARFNQSPVEGSLPPRWPGSWTTLGPATSGSCPTWSSGWWCWDGGPWRTWTICPRPSGSIRQSHGRLHPCPACPGAAAPVCPVGPGTLRGPQEQDRGKPGHRHQDPQPLASGRPGSDPQAPTQEQA